MARSHKGKGTKRVRTEKNDMRVGKSNNIYVYNSCIFGQTELKKKSNIGEWVTKIVTGIAGIILQLIGQHIK